MTCTVCTTKTELYLCTTCITQLRDWLRGMPRWIRYLEDAATGQTRLGESERRSTERGSPMLVNLKASDQLAYTRSVLLEWVRDVTECSGLEEFSDTQSLAKRLGRHVHDIALDPHANICHREIRELITDIEHIINRPWPARYLGNCPTTENGQRCGHAITAKHNETQTTCTKCKTIHNTETLITNAIDDVTDWLFSEREILDIMAAIGEPIPRHTWKQWRQTQRIPERQTYGDQPKYWLKDIRTLRTQNICSVDGCDRKHHGNGLCDTHRKQVARAIH